MRSEFLEQETQEYQSGGIMGVVGSLYGWSTLGMVEQFSETGRYYIPWSGTYTGTKAGVGVSMVGRGKIGIAPQVAGKVSDFRKIAVGTKYVGSGALGTAQLVASRGVGLAMSGMTWTDPYFYAFSLLTGSVSAFTLPGAIAWFGGSAMLRNAARAMERSRYIDMKVPFMETQGSYTSRQRAVRAIAESHLQARSAIGNEAQLFHR